MGVAERNKACVEALERYVVACGGSADLVKNWTVSTSVRESRRRRRRVDGVGAALRRRRRGLKTPTRLARAPRHRLATRRRIQACGSTKDEVAEMMLKVGFSKKMMADPVTTLSGGWRMKLALSRAMC